MLLGTQLGTGKATALGTQLDQGVKRVLYALTNFSAANYYGTLAAGGEAGQQNFGIITVFRVNSLGAAATRFLSQKLNSGTPAGWQKFFRTTNEIQATYRASGAYVDTPSIAITASEVGRLHVAITHLTTTQARMWLNRWEKTPGTAITTYVPGNTSHMIGQNGGLTGAATGIDIVETAAFAGAPTDAQMQAAFDTIRGSGTIPVSGLAGFTFTHKWPDPALLAQLAAPASIPDVVTGATADAMAKTGAPTVVAIDLSRDGRRIIGASGYSNSDAWQGPAGSGNIPDPGFFVWWGKTDGGSGTTWPVHASIHWRGTSGYTNVALANNINGPAVNLDTYKGLPVIVIGQFIGGTYRLHLDFGTGPAQVGSDVAGALLATVTELQLGRSTQFVQHAAGSTLYGFQWGQSAAGGLTAQEIANVCAATWSAGRLASIPSRSQHLWDLTRDADENGGVVPATVKDRLAVGGAYDLARVGTLQPAPRVERVYSYETTPIAYGASAFTDADYFEGTGFPGDVNSFWESVLLIIQSQQVASSPRALSGQSTAAGGYELRTTGTNTVLTSVLYNAAASPITGPTAVAAAADVGKLLLYTVQFDSAQQKIRAFVKRAEVGTGQAIVGYAPAPGGSVFRVGRNATATGFSANGVAVLGTAYGTGVLSVAEYQAHHDAVMATEQMVGVPGRASTVLRATSSGAFGTLTRVGSPSVVPVYARAWA